MSEISNNKRDPISINASNALRNNMAVTRAYAFTNENIRRYIELLNIKNTRVATVGSSGDQAYYAVYKDAKEVQLIDANPLTKPVVELKTAAIKNMARENFLDFWSSTNILDEKTIKSLMPELSENTRDFWERVLLRAKESRSSLFSNRLIHADSFLCVVGLRVNKYSDLCDFYRKDRAYDILKRKLNNVDIDYKIAEFEDFPEVLQGKYGTIMLSNIYDYYAHDRKRFAITAGKLVRNNLEENGTAQIYYSMSPYQPYSIGSEYSQFEEDWHDYNEDLGDCQRYLIDEGVCDQYIFNNPFIKVMNKVLYPEDVDKKGLVLQPDGTNMMYVYEK